MKVILRLAASSVDPLLEKGTKLIDSGKVSLLGILEVLFNDEEVFFVLGQLLQEINLFETYLLEEVGVTHIMFHHSGAIVGELIDFLFREVFDANSIKEGLLVYSYGFLLAHTWPWGHRLEGQIICLDLSGFVWICLDLSRFVWICLAISEAHLGARELLFWPLLEQGGAKRL